jgi:hypothetical protein
MILGFIFQLTALRFGDLALVQPILAAEILFVFGYLAIARTRRVQRRDWLAAAAMSAWIGVFLHLAAPSGGRPHAPGSSWLLAGLVTAGVVLAALAVAFGLGRRPGASQSRRAAVLGAATGIAWGSWALSSRNSAHTSATAPPPSCPPGRGTCSSPPGRRPCCWPRTRWRPGPLAASQPGFTILDPLSASLLGCSCSASTSGPEPRTWPARR